MTEQLQFGDRDFKYVMQDTSHYYLGGRMSFQEMIEWEDVPFKIKGIINRSILPKTDSDKTFAEYFADVETKSFDYQMIKQLHIKVKAGFYKEKINRKGEVNRKYVSKVYSFDDYRQLTEKQKGVITEEIIFSKLALLAFSM